MKWLKDKLGLLLTARDSAPLPPPVPPARESSTHEFLLAEYESLTEFVNARDERIDRFLTIYLALAGAPFVLYATLLRNAVLPVDLSRVPAIVAASLIFVSLAGYAVLKIIVQLRFSALLYIRAMNGIRRCYGGANPVASGLMLPPDPRYPAYCEGPRWRLTENGGMEVEQRKYMFEVVFAIALVNGAYLGLGLFYFPSFVNIPSWVSVLGPILAAMAYVVVQVHYYFLSAKMREARGLVPGRI